VAQKNVVEKTHAGGAAALTRVNRHQARQLAAVVPAIPTPTNQTMKSTSIPVLSGLALGIISMTALAEDAGGKKPEGGGPGGPGGGNRPVPPLIAALDANHDGVIDASEIANASKALATLDKNGDGKLTGDEIHPARPPGGPDGGKKPGGPEGGKGGPDGKKRGGPDGAKGGKPGEGKKPE
jgi:hypothetical protein